LKVKGYTGKYLDIDLSSKEVTVKKLDPKVAKDFLGGYGFITKTLMEIPKGTDALSKKNIICFWLGPMAGSIVPTPSKYSVGAKSPLTGVIGFGISSGYFGAELKRAGYDGIVFRGKAKHLSYVFIDDDVVKIVDCRDIAGKTTWETETLIKEKYNDESVRVASIGISGEKLNKMACITNARNRQVGRSGMGAVMGSKNLKAVAVRGSGSIQVHDLPKLLEFCNELNKRCQTGLTEKYRKYGTPANVLVHQKLGCLPTRNFQEGSYEHADDVSGQTMLKRNVKKLIACEGCSIACDHFNIIDKGQYKGANASVDYESLWSLGPNCGINNVGAITLAVQYCDTHGIDTISAGMTVSWAMECFEKGLLTKEDTDGLDLKFGNHKAMVECVRRMCFREGNLGELLADGSKIAAKKIGKKSINYSIQCKGMEWAGYSMRSLQTGTLGFCTSVRGACYLRSGSYQYDVKHTVDRFSLDDTRGKLVSDGEDIYSVIDSLIICKFTRKIYKNDNELCKLLYLVTGIKWTVKEFLKTGERIHNLAKLFNIKHGWKKSDDYPPWRAFNEYLKDKPVLRAIKSEHKNILKSYTKLHGMKKFPVTVFDKKGAIIRKDEYEVALLSYYKARGWDKDGIPTKKLLKELRLEEYK
jgi:aldehyde:ferredoxin oxidoreductase